MIDPLALEAYNVTAQRPDQRGGQQQPADRGGRRGDASGAISVKIPSSFDTAERCLQPADQGNGDRVVTLGELADIRLTFQDRDRHGALQRRDHGRAAGGQAQGFNVIDTAALVRQTVARSAQPGRWSCATRARRHHARPVGAGPRHGPPARGLGPDGHRAGDDRGAGRARHPLGHAGGLRDPDLVPAVLHRFWASWASRFPTS
jgi:hypothetical protein